MAWLRNKIPSIQTYTAAPARSVWISSLNRRRCGSFVSGSGFTAGFICQESASSQHALVQLISSISESGDGLCIGGMTPYPHSFSVMSFMKTLYAASIALLGTGSVLAMPTASEARDGCGRSYRCRVYRRNVAGMATLPCWFKASRRRGDLLATIRAKLMTPSESVVVQNFYGIG